MEVPAETNALVVAGVTIASVVIGVLTYLFKRPSGEPAPSAISGAAIIDSRIGHGLVEVLDRLVGAQLRTAIALENINRLMADRDKQIEAERERHEMDELRREVAELKRLRDNQSRRGP